MKRRRNLKPFLMGLTYLLKQMLRTLLNTVCKALDEKFPKSLSGHKPVV